MQNETVHTERPLKIFIAEDDFWYGELIQHHLSANPDNDVYRYTSGKTLLKDLHLQPDVITLDYTLPDMMGDEVLNRIKQEVPDCHVIAISGQENISTAVDILKKELTIIS